MMIGMGQDNISATPGRLYLAGYGNAEPAAFFARLRAHQIDVALDVRLSPRGRLPELTGQAFLDALVESGGARRARWVPRLANGTLERDDPPQLVDPGAVDDLIQVLALGRKVALICACWRTVTCHRRVIAEQVSGRLPTVEVVNLDMPFPKREGRPKPPPVVPAPRTRTGVELEERLAQTSVLGVPSTEITTHMTEAVSAWASERGWLAIPEMSLPFLVDTPAAPGRSGRVDLYIARPGWRRDLVVEIDRTMKAWSGEKLRLAAASGYKVLWVRWGKATMLSRPATLPPEVEFVPVPLARSPHAQRAVAVMARLDGESADRMRTAAASLSGSEHALLVATIGTAGPAGLTDVASGSLWATVDTHLNERSVTLLALRFGRHGRPLTLAGVAEQLASAPDQAPVSRERIRQLETKALRSLARWVRINRTGLESIHPRRGERKREDAANTRHVAPAAALADISRPDASVLAALVAEIHASTGPITVALTAHILRGSRGPRTQALIGTRRPPHVGELKGVPIRALISALRELEVSDRASFLRPDRATETDHEPLASEGLA
jgi:hypothetical protein